MSEREKIITLRWIWSAVLVLLFTMWVLLFSGIIDYLDPPNENLSAADDSWIWFIMFLVVILPFLTLGGIAGFVSSFLIKSGVYRYHGYEIRVYAGYSQSYVKLSGELRDGSYLFLWKKSLFSAPQARNFTLGNGEEITVHILRTNRIAVQTPNGYIGEVGNNRKVAN